MKSKLTSQLTKALVVITVLGFMSANMSVAKADTKEIMCLKDGTKDTKKSSIGTNCPKGWTLLEPRVIISLNAIYKGKMTVSWSENHARATTPVPGVGTGTTAGLGKLSFTLDTSGSEHVCQNLTIRGTLSGGGSTLIIKSFPTATDCHHISNGSTFTQLASITVGTGKFAGATGTLKLTGTLSAESQADSGFSESGNFTFKLSGNIKTK